MRSSPASRTLSRTFENRFPAAGQTAGSIFTFDVKGGIKEAQTVIDSLRLFSLLANVGDAKSLAIHPATTTHAQLSGDELLKHGIRPNTIRVSIGIEDADDIIQDLDQALSRI